MASKKRTQYPRIDYTRPDWPEQQRRLENMRRLGRNAAVSRYKNKQRLLTVTEEPIKFAHREPVAAVPYQDPRYHPFKFKRHMSAAAIQELHDKQSGRCAICLTDILPFGRSRAVDHDHKTGALRGMLCKSCNIGLGNFRDNPLRLVNALVYLGFIDKRFFRTDGHIADQVVFMHPDEAALRSYDAKLAAVDDDYAMKAAKVLIDQARKRDGRYNPRKPRKNSIL